MLAGNVFHILKTIEIGTDTRHRLYSHSHSEGQNDGSRKLKEDKDDNRGLHPSFWLAGGAILGESLALCDYKTFPDGESYTQVTSPIGDEVVIIQSTSTDRDLVYLLQL